MYLQHMLLKIKKTIWNLHLSSIMSIVFASFKHPKLPISIKIPVVLLYLHDRYISKFEFMNYLFANLVTWLPGCNCLRKILSFSEGSVFPYYFYCRD